MARKLKDRQLLWVDLADRDRAALDEVAAALDLDSPQAGRLAQQPTQVKLTQFPEHIHLVLEAMEAPHDGDAAVPNATADRRFLDVVAGHNWVLTIHDGPFEALARLDASTEGETRLGALDAAGFVAAIADEVIAGYFKLIEGIEREIDHLDELALQRRPENDLLVAIVALRRRIGQIRRTLAPHRGPFAAMTRPEMELHDELGRPWPDLIERLERALESVENLRELLLGTFDIHMAARPRMRTT